MQTIDFMGVGKIGMPICQHLIDAGYTVVDYRRSSLAEFENIGGLAATSPGPVATRAEIVFSCLPGGGALDDVVAGQNGLLKSVRDGAIVVELGSVRKQPKRCRAKDSTRPFVRRIGAANKAVIYQWETPRRTPSPTFRSLTSPGSRRRWPQSNLLLALGGLLALLRDVVLLPFDDVALALVSSASDRISGTPSRSSLREPVIPNGAVASLRQPRAS